MRTHVGGIVTHRAGNYCLSFQSDWVGNIILVCRGYLARCTETHDKTFPVYFDIAFRFLPLFNQEKGDRWSNFVSFDRNCHNRPDRRLGKRRYVKKKKP